MIVCDSLTNALVHQIDSVQREAILMITRALINLLHAETGLEYMQGR